MDKKYWLGVIGGSGLYDFPALENKKTLLIDTPFGEPSSPIISGEISGHAIAFLARHGIGHIFSPSEVNYRANIYALKSIGVDRIVSISACGSLREDLSPGHIVIPNQIFDFTHKRERTFFGNGAVVHVSVANPYCPELSNQIYQAVLEAGATVHKKGTYLTIEGPRFSTIAESKLYRQWGMSIIGMTACPEVFLAREAEICYTTMAHVTDYDVWYSSEESVTVEKVIKVLQANTEIAQKSILNLINNLTETRSCECDIALKNALMTRKDLIPTKTGENLNLLLK
ncbi:MAG: S-methyl-5'-thioadenosine phosphorylase [Pelolinea sp.]|nr:S-methyl-5'-thioadenosine phosphorylase [Pelolinea sp.]